MFSYLNLARPCRFELVVVIILSYAIYSTKMFFMAGTMNDGSVSGSMLTRRVFSSRRLSDTNDSFCILI